MRGGLGSRWRRWVAVVAALVLSGGPAGLRAGVAESAESPIGAHSMLQLSFPYSFMRAMFAEAARMRASAIRLDVAPALVFTDPSGRPDFTGLDAVLTLARHYHLRVVGDLFTIPWWIANCQSATDVSQMARCGTDDLSAYQSMIGQIVRHSDPVIRDWEIWNEPDLGSFFTGSPQQYASMLRAAHDTVKAIDPQAEVLLGGISGPAGMNWLARVFSVPGADAAHAFDVANIHERGRLDGLADDLASWQRFFAGYGFAGPLWVTEHGYPADPAFQYDGSYHAGSGSQTGYLTASIPTLLEAGAAKVFVTERDNLGGQFASEGLLGGDVLDPGVPAPQVVEKPAFAAVEELSNCYVGFGRDCPGPAPVASPSPLAIPPARVGSSAVSIVSVRDAGRTPVQLGTLTLLAATGHGVGVTADGCSAQILEPDRTCAIAVRFMPLSGGAATAALALPSENGTLQIPVSAVAPAVSSLLMPPPGDRVFRPSGAGAGAGARATENAVLRFANPLGARVRIASVTLSGRARRRFSIRSDRCAGATLAPAARCSLIVVFKPAGPGVASAVLTLHGDGPPAALLLTASQRNSPQHR
jgi:hypothetical protein